MDSTMNFDDSTAFKKEIFCDTYYCLGFNTLFFGILVEHIEDDYVPFCIDDFEKMRLRFINTGRRVIHKTFTYQELIEHLDFLSKTPEGPIKYITDLGNHHYVANMKAILNDAVFTEEEKIFFNNDPQALKVFHLFCRLALDMRLTTDDSTVKLLRLEPLATNNS